MNFRLDDFAGDESNIENVITIGKRAKNKWISGRIFFQMNV